MHPLTTLTVLALSCAVALSLPSPPWSARQPILVPGAAAAAPTARRLIAERFIVVLQPGVDLRAHLAAVGIDWPPSTPSSSTSRSSSSTTTTTDGPKVVHVFRRAFHGYALRCSDSFLLRVRARVDEVLLVEQDAYLMTGQGDMHAAPPQGLLHPSRTQQQRRGEQLNPPSWGLDRVDQRQLPLDLLYQYPDQAGAGVDAFVVDTGIDTAHADFEGRAVWGKTTAEGSGDQDGNGHGTHVAGTIGGRLYGIAKKVTLVAVKVFNDAGFGSTADVIAGLDFVLDSVAERKRAAVAVMPLGGSRSASLDAAVATVVDAGIVVVAAAGGSAADACLFSPGALPQVITAAASDLSDTFASNSNHGACVKIVAPGNQITSTWINNRTQTLSGSSMSCAHAAGVAVLIRSTSPSLTPDEVLRQMQRSATPGVLSGVPANTPNLLVFVDN